MALFSRKPFSRTDPDIAAIALTAETRHADRLAKYRKHWRMYRGNHWDGLRDKNEPTVTMNYCRAIVDEQASFLFGNGFSVAIPDDPGTPANEKEDREFVRNLLDRTWEANKRDLLALEAAQMGGICGDVFFRVSWEEDDPLEDPYARVDVLPSQYVFPSFGGPAGVDGKRVDSVLIVFPRYDNGEDIQDLKVLTGDSKRRIRLYAEEWYRDKVIIFREDGSREEKPNDLGEIPIVHVANYTVPGEYYGLSDLDDLIDLQKEMNEKATDVSDVVNYHAAPTTIVKGAKLKELEKGANKVWAIPAEASVHNLELHGELGASTGYLAMVKNALHELSGTPEVAFGTGAGAGATGAGVAMRYLPMIRRRNRKILTYGLGLRLVNRLMLKLTAMMDDAFGEKFNALKGNKYRNTVVFADPLPRDESIELDRAAKRMDLGLSSRKHELEKMGYSQAEILDIMTAYATERQEAAEMEMALGQKYYEEADPMDKPSKSGAKPAAGNPNPDRSLPEARGENHSIGVQQGD